MATVEENTKTWGEEYDWRRQGEEWSDPWGGSDMQWYGTILPRIQGVLSGGHALEIACGYGRWTRYLKACCSQVTAIDVARSCIDACKRRFAGENVSLYQNDGKRLDMVSDRSVDFVFSYDSLVHADMEVIDAYLGQFPRILRPNGAAFLHHSNLAAYVKAETPGGHASRLSDAESHWRDPGVSALSVRRAAERHGLQCIRQEVVTWRSHFLIDCYSTIVLSTSTLAGANRVIENMHHWDEALYWGRLSRLYGELALREASLARDQRIR